MKILFDVGHPSFVYLFKNCAHYLITKGDEVLFTARDKDLTIDLLKVFNFPYVNLGKTSKSIMGKVLSVFKFDYRLHKAVREFEPDLILSGASPYAAHVAHLMGLPHVLFDDTENKEQVLLYKYCSQTVITPQSFTPQIGKRHFKYPGSHEIAYLHPNWFKPDLPIDDEKRPIIMVRFISHAASHDTFIHSLSAEQKLKLVNVLSAYGEVLISSELELPKALESYRYKGPIEQIHTVMSRARLVVGESATMAAEAAVLGIPAVFFDSNGRCYTREIEKDYGLIFNFGCSEDEMVLGLAKIEELLFQAPEVSRQAGARLLHKSIDLSAFMIWIVENHSEMRRMSKQDVNDKIKEFLSD